MAIIPESQYPGKITPASTAYPYGQARNITLPGDGTGTPWEAALVNDLFGFQQALLEEAEIVPSGDPETATKSQYLEAAKKVIGGDKPIYRESVAEIEALSLDAGATVYLTQEGRAGTFVIKTGVAPKSDPYAGIYINLANGNHAMRRYDGMTGDGGINVEWFGAVPDDSTNNSPFVQAAIDAGGAVYFPAVSGAYLIDEPLIIEKPNGFTIRGENRKTTIVKKRTTTAANIQRTYDSAVYTYDEPSIFTLVAPNESVCRHVTISNLNTIGLGGSTRHIYAPRVSYCHFDNMDASAGASFFYSDLLSFVMSFDRIRSNQQSNGHWNVSGTSNAYTLYQCYANANVSSNDSSSGYIFNGGNVTFIGCDTDSVNFGWQFLGGCTANLIGCFTESRVYQVFARGDSRVFISGGTYKPTYIGSQATSQAAVFLAEDNAQIVGDSFTVTPLDFTGGTYANKYLYRAAGSANVTLSDIKFGNDILSYDDLILSNTASIAAYEGNTCLIDKKNPADIANRLGSLLNRKRITGTHDFASSVSFPILTFDNISYGRSLIAKINLTLKTDGNGSDPQSMVQVGSVLLSAARRNTETINQDERFVGAAPDTAPDISFSYEFSGNDLFVTATASTASLGDLFYEAEVEYLVSNRDVCYASDVV